MANKENLKPPFSSENQPPGEKKSRKGIPNRATVFKKLLGIKVTAKHPDKDKPDLNITLHEKAALGQLIAAADGNPTAWKEIQDTLFGKMTDNVKHEGEMNFNIKGKLDLAIDKIYGDGDGTN